MTCITDPGEKNPATAGEEETKNMNTPNDTDTPTHPRRPGFWLRAIEQRKHALAHEYRKGLGDTAREGISDEDYATTMATLERMARNLGWDEEQPPFGRGFGGHGRPGMRGHRFGPRRPSRDEAPEA